MRLPHQGMRCKKGSSSSFSSPSVGRGGAGEAHHAHAVHDPPPALQLGEELVGRGGRPRQAYVQEGMRLAASAAAGKGSARALVRRGRRRPPVSAEPTARKRGLRTRRRREGPLRERPAEAPSRVSSVRLDASLGLFHEEGEAPEDLWVDRRLPGLLGDLAGRSFDRRLHGQEPAEDAEANERRRRLLRRLRQAVAKAEVDSHLARHQLPEEEHVPVC